MLTMMETSIGNKLVDDLIGTQMINFDSICVNLNISHFKEDDHHGKIL